MGSTTVIGKTFLALDAVKLGRLTTNTVKPDFDYFEADAKYQPKISSNLSQKCYEALKSESDRRFITELTRLVSLSHSRHTGKSTQVSTEQMMEYRLDNAALWWRKLVAIEETQTWIHDTIGNGEAIYLVTGYFTFFDAKVTEGSSCACSSKGDVILPLGLVVEASTGVIPPGKLADPRLSWNSENSVQRSTKFIAPGEQVCAIRYNRVNWRWFRSKELDRTVLEKKDVLRMYGDTKYGVKRGSGKKDGNDVVELVLDKDGDGKFEPEIEHKLRYASETGEMFIL